MAPLSNGKADQLYAQHAAPSIKGAQRVDLLKKLEGSARELFQTHQDFEEARMVLGNERKNQVLKAVLDQAWTGITDYSQDWFKVYDSSTQKQQLQRAFIRKALAEVQHGFDAFDALLLHHSSLLAGAFDTWYINWAKTVQHDKLAPQLSREDREGTLPKDCYNHYTIIGQDTQGKYTNEAYATYFPEELSAIEALFDRCIADLEQAEATDSAVKSAYLAYLSQYRTALAETQVSMLEAQWQLLDEKWMAIKHWIQVVHDIEYGYGDPLRCKVAPDFSCRLMDETYSAENKTIDRIQEVMVDYFKGRTGPLAKAGIGALKQSMAGIYYLPFQAATSLFFRFSGQSIPNRTEVREKYGVKIYFDPVSTAAREEDAKDLARQVCADQSRADDINTVGTIVYHVAAHEIGHAIYSLDSVRDVIKVSTKTLLEEPRAELTALHTLRLLLAAGLADLPLVQKTLASFMLQDLRRYSMFESQAIRPYTISAMSCWQRAVQLQYIHTDSDGKVHIDDSKALAFLEETSRVFEGVLDAEDQRDGPAIEAIMQQLEAAEGSKIVQHLVHELYTKKKKTEQPA